MIQHSALQNIERLLDQPLATGKYNVVVKCRCGYLIDVTSDTRVLAWRTVEKVHAEHARA